MSPLRPYLLAGLLAMSCTVSSANAAIISYSYGTDFGDANFTSGDVTALAELVPGFGEVADFSGFTAGYIAIIERGDLTFATKIANAQAAGAVGVIILNRPPDNLNMGPDPNELRPTNIPTVRFSLTLSQELRDELALDPATNLTYRIRLSNTEPPLFQRILPDNASVPEPSSLAIFGIGACLAGFGAARRRRQVA
jgi:hypothetical protein